MSTSVPGYIVTNEVELSDISLKPSGPPEVDRWRMGISRRTAGDQLHFDFVASVKLVTEFTTPDAAVATAAICAAEGFDGSAFTALVSESIDDLIALVSLGKSLFAELTTEFASLWIFLSCDSKPLTPLLAFKFVSPLTEFCRLVRSEQ